MSNWITEHYEKDELISIDILPEEIILTVPFHISENTNFCSEASVQMLLQYYYIYIDQQDIHNQGYWTYEQMKPLLEQHLKITEYTRENYEPEEQFFQHKFMLQHLNRGSPILLRYETPIGKHTIVITGYLKSGFIILANDPDTGPLEVEWDTTEDNIFGMMAFQKATK